MAITKSSSSIKTWSKRRWTLLLSALLTLAGIQVSAQEFTDDISSEVLRDSISSERAVTAADAFSMLPIKTLDLLRPSDRLDMLEYYRNNAARPTVNCQLGVSELDTVTDSYLKVSLTDVSNLQIKRLPTKKGPVFAVVYSIENENVPADSQLMFFDDSMQQLDAQKYFKTPELKVFFDIPKGSTTKMKELEEMVPYPTVQYTLSPDDEKLRGRLTVGHYMPIEDYKLIELFVRPQVSWTWKGSAFKKD